jgi:hypothetical protein
MSAQYFIAKTVQDNDYVVVLDSKVVAGPFATAILDRQTDYTFELEIRRVVNSRIAPTAAINKITPGPPSGTE